MTVKEFDIIASAIRKAWDDEVNPSVADGFAIAMDSVVERLSDALERENLYFDRFVFREACRRCR
tara:strand:+ start:92 stop:286 length:195 start_codon:yes stop_codon:yes gene_type:complete